MHDCPECGMPYTSTRAADECADMDVVEDALTARIIRHRRPGHDRYTPDDAA